MRIIQKYLKKDIYLQKISLEERQKIIDQMRLINMLDNQPNQPTKFRTK